MSDKKEFRVFTGEFRAAGDTPQIEGYAAVFGVETDMGYGCTESIRAGAFSRALAERQDVRCLVNHDPNMVLGRTKSNTLRMAEDTTGLKFSTDLPDTQVAKDTRTLVTRGDIDQCSFGFICRQDEVTYNDDGTCHREIIDADLFDVSVVTYPAYESTHCEARSVSEKAQELKAAAPQKTEEKVPEVNESDRERMKRRLELEKAR